MTQIIMPAKPGVIRQKRCETCGCSSPDATGRQMECHFSLRDALVPSPNGPQAVSYYPPTQPDGWCVEGWRPKIEIAGVAN